MKSDTCWSVLLGVPLLAGQCTYLVEPRTKQSVIISVVNFMGSDPVRSILPDEDPNPTGN